MLTLAYRLYLVFMMSWFLHLPARIPLLGVLRFDLLLVAAISSLTIFSSSDNKPGLAFGGSTRKYLYALIVYVIVTLPLVEWPGSVLKYGLASFIKGVVFFFFTVRLIDTEKKLNILLIVFLGCQVFRVLEPLYLHVTDGYWGSTATTSEGYLDRLSGSPHDVVNPNGLAFIVLTVLPLLHFLCTVNRWGTALYLALAPCLVYALILTSSRSGFLGLTIVLFGFYYHSRHRLALVAAAALGLALIIPSLSPEQLDRYRSIFDHRSQNAVTADFRKEGLKNDFKVIFHKPFFGHGLGTSLEANVNFGSSLQLAHNLFIEVGQELGLCGLAIFMGFLGSVLSNYLAVRRALTEASAHNSPFLLALAKGGQVWLLMNLLFSFFSYGLHGYEWYLFAGISVVLGQISVEQNHDARTPLRQKLLRAGADSPKGVAKAFPPADPAGRSPASKPGLSAIQVQKK